MYKPGGAYYKEFVTSNPSTKAAANADSTPTATANHNGADDGAFTLAVANLDTGRYKITGTIPGGYAAGDVLNVSVAATCSGVAGKAVVDTQVIDSASGLNLAGVLSAPRALDAIADGSITLNDALWSAVCGAAGKEAVSGTSYEVKTPSTGTIIRTFTLDQYPNPNSRS